MTPGMSPSLNAVLHISPHRCAITDQAIGGLLGGMLGHEPEETLVLQLPRRPSIMCGLDLHLWPSLCHWIIKNTFHLSESQNQVGIVKRLKKICIMSLWYWVQFSPIPFPKPMSHTTPHHSWQHNHGVCVCVCIYICVWNCVQHVLQLLLCTQKINNKMTWQIRKKRMVVSDAKRKETLVKRNIHPSGKNLCYGGYGVRLWSKLFNLHCHKYIQWNLSKAVTNGPNIF